MASLVRANRTARSKADQSRIRQRPVAKAKRMAVRFATSLVVVSATMTWGLTGSVTGVGPAIAGADPIADCTTTAGVLVAVDFSHWGGTMERGCDATPTTGYAALQVAGFTTAGTEQDGDAFICRINDEPPPSEDPCITTPPGSAYWSYWHANADQSTWTFSQQGAMSYHPEAGSIDGWAFGAGSPPSFSPAVARNPPTTSVLIPSNGSKLSGTAVTLDASASNATKVQFWLLGGSYGYSGKMIGTATLTAYGWLSSWNTTTVPNGSYALFSEALNSGVSVLSPGVSVSVENPPTTSVLIPATGTTLSGTAVTLDASASNASEVQFWLLGGSYGYSGKMLCSATLTEYGWLCSWNSATVANGSYVLVSEATNSAGSTFSSGVSITNDN